MAFTTPAELTRLVCHEGLSTLVLEENQHLANLVLFCSPLFWTVIGLNLATTHWAQLSFISNKSVHLESYSYLPKEILQP